MLASVLTVSEADAVVTAPQVLVATTSYTAASPNATGLSVSDGSVAPGMLMPALRHWYVGAGVPLAAAVKMALPPTHAACAVGGVVIAGPVLTVSVAAWLVTEAHTLVTMQS